MYVFVFVNVQERIFKKRTKNHEKMTKRARDLEKCQKPEPGKPSGQNQSSYGQKGVLKVSEITRMVLPHKFEEITHVVLQLSRLSFLVLLKNILENCQLRPSSFEK